MAVKGNPLLSVAIKDQHFQALKQAMADALHTRSDLYTPIESCVALPG